MNIVKKVLHSFSIKYFSFLIPYILIVFIVCISDLFITLLTGNIGQSAVDNLSIQNFLIQMTILIIIKLIFGSLLTYFKNVYNGKIYDSLKNKFAASLLSSDYTAFSNQKSGEVLSIFTDDLKNTGALLSNSIPEIIFEFVTLLISLVFMFTIHFKITLLFLCLYPVLSFIQVNVSKPIQKQMTERSKKQAEYNHFLIDTLNNATTVSSFHLEDDMMDMFLSKYQQYETIFTRYLKTFLSLIVSGIFLSTIPLIFCFSSSALATIKQTLSIADFIVFTTLAKKANEWLSMLSQRLNNIQTMQGKAVRVLDIMNLEKELVEVATLAIQESSQEYELLLNHISFQYDETIIFDDFSLSIKKGQKLAVIGDSGSGKSTLLKILLALVPIQKGDIYIGGQNTKNLTPSQIRDAISYVPQTPFLFSDSIKNNIILDGVEDEKKLIQTCKDAQILDFIMSLPDGFDTMLSSKQTVSGGQLQRIAIARALYKDAPILLFDEATSALDGISEKDFLNTFQTTLKNKTLLFVTHRSESIKACDRVLNLSNTKIQQDAISPTRKDETHNEE